MGASLNKGNNDPALLAAMMNGGMGGQWNNPFVYLVWMMFANRWMGGNGYGNPNANTSTQAQIQALQNVVQDNHNSDLLMQAVNGNTTATQQLVQLHLPNKGILTVNRIRGFLYREIPDSVVKRN